MAHTHSIESRVDGAYAYRMCLFLDTTYKHRLVSNVNKMIKMKWVSGTE